MKTMLLDLGFAVGKLEEAADGEPMLTIMTPATDGENASSVVMTGWQVLEDLGNTLLWFHQTRGGEHEPETDQDMISPIDNGMGLG